MVRRLRPHLVERYRRATARWRALPDFLVIGTQRGGTTSFFDYLTQHPAVLSPRRKELHYFDTARHRRGAAGYRVQFPYAAHVERATRRHGRAVTGEATPYYLFHPLVPARVAAVVPLAKLIVLLRNPAERAYSHYQHSVREGHETLSFEEALDAEEDRLRPCLATFAAGGDGGGGAHQNFSYVARGMYVPQLERWLGHFPREQLLVLRSEDLFDRPQEVYDRTGAFLGLARYTPDFPALNASSGAPLDPALRRRLDEIFAPSLDELADRFGVDLRP